MGLCFGCPQLPSAPGTSRVSLHSTCPSSRESFCSSSDIDTDRDRQPSYARLTLPSFCAIEITKCMNVYFGIVSKIPKNKIINNFFGLIISSSSSFSWYMKSYYKKKLYVGILPYGMSACEGLPDQNSTQVMIISSRGFCEVILFFSPAYSSRVLSHHFRKTVML